MRLHCSRGRSAQQNPMRLHSSRRRSSQQNPNAAPLLSRAVFTAESNAAPLLSRGGVHSRIQCGSTPLAGGSSQQNPMRRHCARVSRDSGGAFLTSCSGGLWPLDSIGVGLGLLPTWNKTRKTSTATNIAVTHEGLPTSNKTESKHRRHEP